MGQMGLLNQHQWPGNTFLGLLVLSSLSLLLKFIFLKVRLMSLLG